MKENWYYVERKKKRKESNTREWEPIERKKGRERERERGEKKFGVFTLFLVVYNNFKIDNEIVDKIKPLLHLLIASYVITYYYLL